MSVIKYAREIQNSASFMDHICRRRPDSGCEIGRSPKRSLVKLSLSVERTITCHPSSDMHWNIVRNEASMLLKDVTPPFGGPTSSTHVINCPNDQNRNCYVVPSA
eukprot:scaffold1564_cov389-Prasinococcus_capsulatus_cf.AAC.19